MECEAQVTPELVNWVQEALARELQALAKGHEAVIHQLRLMRPPEVVSEAFLQEKPLRDLSETEPDLGTGSLVTNQSFQAHSEADKQSVSTGKSSEIKRLTRSPSSLKDSLTLDDKPLKPFWHADRLVRSCFFEVFFAFLIFLQALNMAIEVQYTGLQWGYELNYEGYNLPASEAQHAKPV